MTRSGRALVQPRPAQRITRAARLSDGSTFAASRLSESDGFRRTANDVFRRPFATEPSRGISRSGARSPRVTRQTPRLARLLLKLPRHRCRIRPRCPRRAGKRSRAVKIRRHVAKRQIESRDGRCSSSFARCWCSTKAIATQKSCVGDAGADPATRVNRIVSSTEGIGP